MREEGLDRFTDYRAISSGNNYYLVYKNLFRDLEKSVKTYAKGRVLDIGCGNKPYLEMFAGKITEYIGCDIVQSSEKKVDVLCEATNIPLPDQGFDTVFSTQTLEHVAEHQKLLDEAYRLLKPGGHIIISAPLYWHLHEEPYDFFRFTKYGFEHIFNKAGFKTVEILSNGGVWATTGQVIIHAMTLKNQGKKSPWYIRFVKKTFITLRFHRLTNWFFSWLDKKDLNPVNTMNYVVVGIKE
jgi:SAM-dependent methyltransferase